MASLIGGFFTAVGGLLGLSSGDVKPVGAVIFTDKPSDTPKTAIPPAASAVRTEQNNPIVAQSVSSGASPVTTFVSRGAADVVSRGAADVVVSSTILPSGDLRADPRKTIASANLTSSAGAAPGVSRLSTSTLRTSVPVPTRGISSPIPKQSSMTDSQSLLSPVSLGSGRKQSFSSRTADLLRSPSTLAEVTRRCAKCQCKFPALSTGKVPGGDFCSSLCASGAGVRVGDSTREGKRAKSCSAALVRVIKRYPSVSVAASITNPSKRSSRVILPGWQYLFKAWIDFWQH